MPKDTFRNLTEDKRERIVEALRCEFKEKPFYNASVSNIIKLAEISRGSFYQYFEDLEDAYFTILDMEIGSVHHGLSVLIGDGSGGLIKALRKYGEIVAVDIFDKGKYDFYKNWYLSRTCGLEKRWKDFQRKGADGHGEFLSVMSMDRIDYLKAVVHQLIENIFINQWNREMFMEKYSLYIKWIEVGILKGDN